MLNYKPSVLLKITIILISGASMNRMSIVILWALALLVLQPALAAEPRQQPTAREQARTVTIFHQPVVMLQATLARPRPKSAFAHP